MIKGVRILNFDDSVVYQKKFVKQYEPFITDLRHLNRSARLWAMDNIASEIGASLKPSQYNALTFIGSSDYHHVSSILLKQFLQPITVIVFDHRPDWNVLWPKVACNSWVSRQVEKVNIINIFEFGVGKAAMRAPWKIAGNLRSVKGGRLKLYGHYPMPLIPKIIPNIYTEDVYISFDKSCLKKQESLTNWEEGRMRLDMVLDIIKAIAKNKNIVGMDVTGEYSLPIYEHVFKKAFAGIARPRKYTALNKSLSEIDEVNESTNIRIAEVMLAK